jgi:2'-hydroxyisoflavone reductase
MEKLLILGGTNFIGRNLLEKLLVLDKYDITLFNRGQSNPDLFPNIKQIIGDRNNSDINLIFDKRWDYVIDLSCYFPDSLKQIIAHINKSLKRYIFISTASVYDMNSDKSIMRNEDSPILDCTYEQSIDTSLATYGNRKAACEQLLVNSDLNYTILRPALVYGQYDSTDRFYYWLYQLKNGNEILLPDKGKNLFSVTYVNDLVQVIIKALAVENDSVIYNVSTTPDLSLARLVYTASMLLGKQPELRYCDARFLKDNNIQEWTDLPLWLDCDYFTFDNTKIQNDLEMKITDFDISVSETISYYDKTNWATPKYGMSDDMKNGFVARLNLTTNSDE